MRKFFLPNALDLNTILDDLASIGATSVQILQEDFRLSLLEEAEGYTYQPEEEVVGSGDKIVRQQMGSFEDFPDESQYVLLRDAFQALLEDRLADVDPYPFDTPLRFNSMVLQKYEPGSIGITPHRDGLRYINLVCVFIIGGRGKFFICADRSGTDAREIDTAPGKVILMRAPGFRDSQHRPFHYVTDIPETRYTFGLRQNRRR